MPTPEPPQGGKRRLTRRVNVAGQWYGPNDSVPDEVAEKITNPKAWEGGRLPRLTGVGGKRTDDDMPTLTPEVPVEDGQDTGPSEAGSEPELLPPPPRSGPGSGIGAWETYARSMQVPIKAGVGREEIIAACVKAKVLDPAGS